MRVAIPSSPPAYWLLFITLLAFALIPAAVSRVQIHANASHDSNANPNQARAPLVGSYIVLSHPGASVGEFNRHMNDVKKRLAESNEVVCALRSSSHLACASEQFKKPFYMMHDYSFGDVLGYSGSFDQETINFISSQSELINIVENDKLLHVYDTPGHTVQHGATWGIVRISHHKSNQHSDTDYVYPSSAGNNVMAYIIDTGIYTNHSDFEGRAQFGASFCDGDPFYVDGNGHGTHVAGTVGGKLYGVAKKINLMAVKVLDSDGSGTLSGVIKGIEWAMNHHLERVKNNTKARSVANLSLGGGKSPSLDYAVNFAASKNLHFAVAAGNSYSDACMDSPAGAKGAITVAASNDKDELACFSNHGKCVAVVAPGEDITSAWNDNPDSVNTISGTSMASPHVCGSMALILSENPDHLFTRIEIVNKLRKMSTKNILKNMPKKNHADFPICPYISDRLNSLRVSGTFSANRGNGDDDDVEVLSSDEGKTPNKLLYVLDDDHEQSEQDDLKIDQWERFGKYVAGARRKRRVGY